MPLSLIVAAILPSLVLTGYILFKDREHPEPAGYLFKAFAFGMLSTGFSLCFSVPLMQLGAYSAEPAGVWGHMRVALFGAALPEELAKLILLALLLRRNPHFDEYFDGIVYAVCIGMGFAFVENIGYLLQAGDYWMNAGMMRGIISVPGHYAFAVLMGYFYSLSAFSPAKRGLYRVLALLAPVLAHMAFDWVLMVAGDAGEGLSGLLSIVFLLGFIRLQKLAQKGIARHLA
ncbi:MAG: PrsW family intramembrane metalloprotease [Bacteroidales bacterium]|nr:PrsW family intramembrane metalloprotease [Bacteroidales bacterium]